MSSFARPQSSIDVVDGVFTEFSKTKGARDNNKAIEHKAGKAFLVP